MAQLGMVGLGRMGANIVRRLMRDGHECVVFDINADAIKDLADEGAVAADSLEDMASKLDAPRSVWVMVPAGHITETTVNDVAAALSKGDAIIDGGNSHYTDDIRRSEEFAGKGIDYIDCGTSGGVFGLERGYCLMIGGPDGAVERLDPIFSTVAPGLGEIERTPGRSGDPTPAEQGYLHCGPTGAGHFVKMVHNGIEYGLMAAYAEGLNIIKHANAGKTDRDADAETAPLEHPEHYQYDIDIADVAEVWRRGSVVSSWLLDLAASALHASPQLEEFGGRVSDSGEGRWTSLAAIEEGIPAPVLTTALMERFSSRSEDEFANKVLSAMRKEFGGHDEKPRLEPQARGPRGRRRGRPPRGRADRRGGARGGRRRGAFAMAASGGHTPWAMYGQLEEQDVPWSKTELFQVDERIAPAGSPDRNLTHLIAAFSIGAQGSLRPMPVDDGEEGAARYAERLPDALDLVHLGLGPDGHTASLVPGDPVLEVTDRRVAITGGEYQGTHRMTVTYPVLAAAKRLLWIVTGAEKRDALAKLLARTPRSRPAASSHGVGRGRRRRSGRRRPARVTSRALKARAMLAWTVTAPCAIWALERLSEVELGFPFAAMLAYTPYVLPTALVVAVVALALRQWIPAGVAGFAVLALALLIAPRVLGGEEASASDGPSVRVLSANVLRGRAAMPSSSSVEVRERRIDVLAAQELYAGALRRASTAWDRRPAPAPHVRAEGARRRQQDLLAPPDRRLGTVGALIFKQSRALVDDSGGGRST